MHTQYNLILSAGVMSRYSGAENTLVLFSEFSISDQMRSVLDSVFDKVYIARDRFYKPVSELDDIKEIRRCLRRVKALRKERFDHIYMSQERIFDLVLCAWAKKNNPAARCYNIEEDAYYSINEKLNAEDYRYSESSRAKRNRFLRAMLLWGYPYNYRDIHYCYGMSSEYHGANLLFPKLARREMQGKELLEITKQELLTGINTLYKEQSVEYPEGKKYTLFFFDLMNRYKNPENVKELVLEIIKASTKEGRTVLFKYHPRETEKFTAMENTYELPSIIPAEKVLYDLKNSDTIVVGNATTSCVVAAKLGYKVISICKMEMPDNKKMHTAMEKMNIQCIENIRGIEKYI